MEDGYVLTMEEGKCTVLFNESEFGLWDDADLLAKELVKQGVKKHEINNIEFFESQGVDYSRYVDAEIV